MSPRRVTLASATGLVGQTLLQGLLADDSVAAVHAVGRRLPDVEHRKLIAHVVDFTALPRLPPIDEVNLALGTTIKAAGSQAAFRAVDFDASLAVARSGIFYNRVKGELEEALSSLGFEVLVIARPSLLTGDRQVLRQPGRTGEQAATCASALPRPFIPTNYRPIAAVNVVHALLKRVPVAQEREVLLSGAMQG